MTERPQHTLPPMRGLSERGDGMMVFVYLLAVVAANLTVAAFGSVSVLPVAFGFVGFTMVARDRLHDRWYKDGLSWKMGTLVVAGGAISFLLNADALRVAVASSVAFAASEAVNAAVYAPMLRRKWPWLARVNAGNVPNALVDSAVFIGITFGFLPWLILGQVVVKVFGGFVWSTAFRRWATVAVPVALLALPVTGEGQLVSSGPGVVSTQYSAEPFVDLFVAGPSISSLTPSVVVMRTRDEWGALTKIAIPLTQDGPSFLNAEVGASWLAFRRHAPEPFVGLYASSPLPIPRVSVAGATSFEPWSDWSWSAVIRLDVLLWMR